MERRAFISIGVCALAGAAVLTFSHSARSHAYSILTRIRGRLTVQERLSEFNPQVRDSLREYCATIGVSYPPQEVLMLGLKQERVLKVYVRGADGEVHAFKTYPILAASGDLGPKLREGDRQVPEGMYRAVSLNPNSRFYLSIELDYPNAFDREVARIEGRTNLGGDIFIHGGAASIGCIAIGDPAIEEVFTLVADTGLENISIIIAPLDLRQHDLPDELNIDWRTDLYNQIAARLEGLPD